MSEVALLLASRRDLFPTLFSFTFEVTLSAGETIDRVFFWWEGSARALDPGRPTGVPQLQENAPPVGLYRRPMPRILGGS